MAEPGYGPKSVGTHGASCSPWMEPQRQRVVQQLRFIDYPK